MKTLPHVNYVPSVSAGFSLFRSAVVLIPTHVILFLLVNAQGDVPVYAAVDEGLAFSHWQYNWAICIFEGLQIGILGGVIAFLTCTGRIDRRDAGLTIGQPCVTLFWIAAPVGVILAAATAILSFLYIYGVLVGAPWLRAFSHPAALVQEFASALHFWQTIWEALVFAPLIEDTLYRGIMVSALDRLGGSRFALLASGVVWAGLHLIYGRPVWSMSFYFIAGIFGAWVFLRSRSLVPVIVLHVLTNVAGVVVLDLSRIDSFQFTGELLN